MIVLPHLVSFCSNCIWFGLPITFIDTICLPWFMISNKLRFLSAKMLGRATPSLSPPHDPWHPGQHQTRRWRKKTPQAKLNEGSWVAELVRAAAWTWRSTELRDPGDPHETEAWAQPVCVTTVRWSREATRTALPRDHSLCCYWSPSNAVWWMSTQLLSAHQGQLLPLLHCAGVYVCVRRWGKCL